MIILNEYGTTPAVVTLYEKSQNNVNPYFTWTLIRKGSFDTIIFYQDDTSTSPINYNRFNITVATSSIGLTAGLIPLVSGEWNYSIYEQTAPYILSTASAVQLVESGLLIVGATFSDVKTYDPNSNQEVKVYRG